MEKFTIKDFRKRFPDDDACLDELMRMRFGEVAMCSQRHKPTKYFRASKSRKTYSCQWCGEQFSPTAGTIFHKSPTPLSDWFYVMYLMTATRSGVSAKEVQRQLGVTYKTAWRMCHQVRKAMDEKPKLRGKVELDETYVGGKRRGTRGRGAEGKTIVFGAVQRKGKLNARVVENAKAKTLMPIVKEMVRGGSSIMTDEFLSYNRLTLNGYKHDKIRHYIREYVRDSVHTNNIEGFWSQLKRGISGTHVWVSRQHLQKYVDEFAFRYNQRADATPMFDRLLRNLVPLA